MASPAPNTRPRPRPPSIRDSPVPKRKAPAKKSKCMNPDCDSPDIQEVEGQMVCVNCGNIISDSIIVNEITYGEASSGAPIVQGASMHEGQRYAKSAAIGFRRGGRSQEDANETSLREGKDELDRLALRLNIQEVKDRAYSLYQLARIHHFHRSKRENAAICLYIACRQGDKPVMLIDFAEQLKCNVFDLGNTYKAFVKKINLEDDMDAIPIIEIEPLLLKYARRLEFGEYAKQVAQDAALIIGRMDRDWIKTGRQPAALCGSCLILAARMNNFRRTVREVVLVVKAGEVTIQKRLEEFRRTKAGRLTVQDFRQFGDRLLDTAEPPVIYQQALKDQRKRKRIAKRQARASESESVASVSATASPTPEEPAARVDADGFAIPNLPAGLTRASSSQNEPASVISADLNAAIVASGMDDPEIRPRKRARKQKDKPIPLEISNSDLAAENDLEKEIEHAVSKHIYEDKFELTHVRAKKIALIEKEKERDRASKLGRTTLAADVSDSVTIGKDEFDDDPEVRNCLLTEREIQVKEKIWVTHNWEWLKLQQEKLLNAALEEASGKKKKKRQQKGKEEETGGTGAETPASSPADASARMLEKRKRKAAFSRHLNYDKLRSIYSSNPKGSPSSTGSDEESDEDDARSTASATAGADGRTASVTSGSAAPSRAGTVEADETLLDPAFVSPIAAMTEASKAYKGKAPKAVARKNAGGLMTPGPTQSTQAPTQIPRSSPTQSPSAARQTSTANPDATTGKAPVEISEDEESDLGSDTASENEEDSSLFVKQVATPTATQSQRKPDPDEEAEPITDDEEEPRAKVGADGEDEEDGEDGLDEIAEEYDEQDHDEETWGVEDEEEEVEEEEEEY